MISAGNNSFSISSLLVDYWNTVFYCHQEVGNACSSSLTKINLEELKLNHHSARLLAEISKRTFFFPYFVCLLVQAMRIISTHESGGSVLRADGIELTLHFPIFKVCLKAKRHDQISGRPSERKKLL